MADPKMAHDCACCGGPCNCNGDAGPKGCSLCSPACRNEADERPLHDRRADDPDHIEPDDVRDECHHGVPYGESCDDCTREGLEVPDDDFEPDA